MDTKAAKHKEQRVGVFVDGSNMYHSSKALYQTNVNFGKILEQAVAGRRLLRAISYVIKSSAQDEQLFFEALKKQGFEVKSKDLQIFSSGAKKGDWDIGIALDTVTMADRLDTVVLVSGDGDFAPLVEYLQQAKGCRVEVMAFGESASLKLKEVADEFIDLSADRKTFLLPLRPFRNRLARGLRPPEPPETG
ncbi:MAG: NYN domain-containing protein [Candidatus Kerfeldbacteria bacterium]|nr:NYN domain-containing protein [Candidatus Kerfeldbacteria bacterium]